ncbi:MAG TPA: hypothetical protein VGW75_14305 [Solirubrobacteraceae bacterium]|nr:hypothetical protein [Solirubrobacteraceae bacterium]
MLALAAAGCGGGERPAVAPPAPPGTLGGVRLQSASCHHWNAAGDADKERAVRGLTEAVSGRTPRGEATTLAAADARRLLDNQCSAPYARHFLLYEIYIRAAGFKSLGAPPS